MNPEIINYHIGAKIGLKKKEKQIYASMEEESILLPLEYISFRKGGFIQIFYGKSIFYSIRIFYLEGTNIFTSKRRTDSAEKSTWLYLQSTLLLSTTCPTSPTTAGAATTVQKSTSRGQ